MSPQLTAERPRSIETRGRRRIDWGWRQGAAEEFKRSGIRLRRIASGCLKASIDLFTVDGDLSRRFDADTHLLTLDVQDGNADICTDGDSFADTAREDEHGSLLGMAQKI
jgi:hypothetical protein